MALKKLWPELVIAAVAFAIAWAFAATVLSHTPSMGLPLDDSYIYLTYAKQFGRAQPFTYYPGGGYSAGSTSVLWPMVLAPFWTLGARGHALVWVSFFICTLLYAATAIGAFRVVRRLADQNVALFAAGLVLAISAFAWTSLSGMEVAFASALLVSTILLLMDQPASGPPRKLLAVCLAATSLSRPEATMIVAGVVAVAVFQRRRDLRAAAWWCTPMLAPLAWVTANRIFAGHFFPNTGVVKSHFYLPGFDWSYWGDAVSLQAGRMFRGLFWDSASPIPLPKLFTLLWLAGAVRVVMWARANGKPLVGALIVAGPFVLIASVICTSSAAWDFQNYRYIAPAFPLLAITAACAAAPLPNTPKVAWWAPAGAVLLGFAGFAYAPMRADMLLFAQGATDTNTQVVALGKYIDAKLPDARVMFHDAGAISYYGDGEVYDMLGLITNHQADIANNGPGARFEFLEHLPADRRPTHFAYYPSWIGTNEFYGEVLMQTPLHPQFSTKARLAGDGDMQIIVASWDHVGTAERPLEPHDGWRIADRVDIADLDSEAAHHWHGELGRRTFGDRTAKWSFVERETTSDGLAIDGGRLIRGKRESFDLAVDPGKPVKLILRTGGARSIPFQEGVAPAAVTIFDDDREVGRLSVTAPDGRFAEPSIDIATHGDTLHVRTEATGPYRAFHWFALQPE